MIYNAKIYILSGKKKILSRKFRYYFHLFIVSLPSMNASFMSSNFKKIFLNDKIVLSLIIINALIIFIYESGISYPIILFIDVFCTLFFLIEMIVKIRENGFRKYWSCGWNRLDFIIVILSTPSLLLMFIDNSIINLSIIQTFRLLRIFRVFRTFHFFPNINKITKGLLNALKQSRAILLGFIVIIIIFSLINCCLFKNVAPEYFDTPFKSIYTVFRLFTVEGWYEIPDTIAAATSPLIGKLSRLYFCLLLCGGGIIGMSFINSIFVDAMVEDNNDDIKEQLNRIEKKLEKLNKDLKA